MAGQGHALPNEASPLHDSCTLRNRRDVGDWFSNSPESATGWSCQNARPSFFGEINQARLLTHCSNIWRAFAIRPRRGSA